MDSLNFNTPVRNADGDIVDLANVGGGGSSVKLITGEGSIRFGVDSNGNYGYLKEGADTVTPFKSGSALTPATLVRVFTESGNQVTYNEDSYSTRTTTATNGCAMATRIDLTNINSITLIYDVTSYWSKVELSKVQLGVSTTGFPTPSWTPAISDTNNHETGEDLTLTINVSGLIGYYNLAIRSHGATAAFKEFIIN